MPSFPSVFGVRWGVFAVAASLFFNTLANAQMVVPPPSPRLDLLQRQSDMLWQQLDFWWPYMRVSQTERITQIIQTHRHCMDIAQYISYNIQRPVPVHVLADAWLNKVRMAAANLRNEYYMGGPRQLQYLRDLEFFLVNAIPAVNFYIAAVSDAYLIRGRALPGVPGFLPPGLPCPQTAQRTLDVALVLNQLRFLMCDVINLVRQIRGGTVVVVTGYNYVVPVAYYNNLIQYYQSTTFTYGMNQAWVPPQVATIPFQAPQGQDFYVPNQAPQGPAEFTQPQLNMPATPVQPQLTEPMPVQPQLPSLQPQLPMTQPQGPVQGPIQGGYQGPQGPQVQPQQQPIQMNPNLRPGNQPGMYFPNLNVQPQGQPQIPQGQQPQVQPQPGQIPPLSTQRPMLPVRQAPRDNFPR